MSLLNELFLENKCVFTFNLVRRLTSSFENKKNCFDSNKFFRAKYISCYQIRSSFRTLCVFVFFFFFPRRTQHQLKLVFCVTYGSIAANDVRRIRVKEKCPIRSSDTFPLFTSSSYIVHVRCTYSSHIVHVCMIERLKHASHETQKSIDAVFPFLKKSHTYLCETEQAIVDVQRIH